MNFVSVHSRDDIRSQAKTRMKVVESKCKSINIDTISSSDSTMINNLQTGDDRMRQYISVHYQSLGEWISDCGNDYCHNVFDYTLKTFLNLQEIILLRQVSKQYNSFFKMEKDKTKSKKDERGKDIFGFVIYKQFKNLSLFNKNSRFYWHMNVLSKQAYEEDEKICHISQRTRTNKNGENVSNLLSSWSKMDQENRLFESCDVSNYQHFLKAVLPQISHLWLFFKARYSVAQENNMFFCNPMRDNLYLADWSSLAPLSFGGAQRNAMNSIDEQWQQEFTRNEVINNQIEKRFSAAKGKIYKKTKKAQENSETQTQKQREKAQERQERKETISHLTNHIKLYKYISRMINAINGYYIENKGYNSDKESQSSLKRLFGDLMSIFSFFMAFGFNEKDNPGINKLDINPYLWELLTKWLLITFIPKFKDYENELPLSKIMDFNHKFPLGSFILSREDPIIRFSRCHSSMEFVFLLQYEINLRYQCHSDEYSRIDDLTKSALLRPTGHMYNFKFENDYKTFWLRNKYNELRVGNNSWYDCCLLFRLNNLLSMYILTNNYFTKHEMKPLRISKTKRRWTIADTVARVPSRLDITISNLFRCTYFYYLNNDPSLYFIKLIEYDSQWVNTKHKQLIKYDLNEREEWYNKLFNKKLEMNEHFVQNEEMLTNVNNAIEERSNQCKLPLMQIGMATWFQKEKEFSTRPGTFHWFYPDSY